MKIGLINGSPKLRSSASRCILQYLQPLLEQDGHVAAAFALHNPELAPEDAQGMRECDVLIFALPLYVDGLPSHMVSCLLQLEKSLARPGKAPTVYAIVNCGFYEGHQAKWALNMMENWCRRTGLRWGYGIGLGAGGVLLSVQSVPLGAGPTRNLAQALRQLASSVSQGVGGENVFTTMNFPKLLYKLAAEIGWCRSARANGLKIRDLSLRRGS
ncbi:MAG TPA: NAD(P)H-dependent oxidoreductase [Firmicutes bacterium]|jgi:hypothetical protein|nr:NAD(P)H-dependent oxidoreductase [Bacillota bacterium]